MCSQYTLNATIVLRCREREPLSRRSRSFTLCFALIHTPVCSNGKKHMVLSSTCEISPLQRALRKCIKIKRRERNASPKRNQNRLNLNELRVCVFSANLFCVLQRLINYKIRWPLCGEWEVNASFGRMPSKTQSSISYLEKNRRQMVVLSERHLRLANCESIKMASDLKYPRREALTIQTGIRCWKQRNSLASEISLPFRICHFQFSPDHNLCGGLTAKHRFQSTITIPLL